ncbi:hypothetical protein [Burkholderia sp. 4M9327F10]|uniref:hypothetical protein n=1 Tax=Burkholderia sp. 4M9327F10 TaxID=2502223 RepID=UPI0010F69AD8|nr:hypothetical protein [Burkholderia sp. 4M9327F10]
MNAIIYRIWFRLGFGLTFVLCLVSFASATTSDCSPDAPRYAPHAITGETCPDIGRMGSTKLAIPRHYILGPDFAYDGVDIWNAESYRNRPKKQSFDLQIRYFSIRIRLNNFKPVENERDLADFDQSERSVVALPRKDNQWIFVQFNYPSLFKKEGKPVDMRSALRRFTQNEFSMGKVTFIRKSDVDGLAHYISPIQSSAETIQGEVNEVFYDEQSNRTLITCENSLRHIPPHDPLSFCHHYFYTPTGDVSIEVGNIRDKQYYLSRWKEIEKGVLSEFYSFIVQ